MTPEQRIATRIENELGGWPRHDDTEAVESLKQIILDEIEHAIRNDEIPQLGRESKNYPIRVFKYAGYPTIVFDGSTFPVVPLPPTRRERVREELTLFFSSRGFLLWLLVTGVWLGYLWGRMPR